MSDGEISQLSNIGNININQDQYLDIIYAKTAILFSVATKAGAILSGANIDEIKSLENFGMNLGMSFQIMDDILDYDSTNDKLGKNIADDFMEGKVTLPIILLNQICSDVEKKLLSNVFKKNNEITYDDFNKIKIMIEKYDIISKSKNLAYQYIKNAKDNLENFQDSKDKKAALSILQYIVKQG
jgi:octaprenyl-diphosphate synthase